VTAAFGDANLPLRFWSKVLPCTPAQIVEINALLEAAG